MTNKPLALIRSLSAPIISASALGFCLSLLTQPSFAQSFAGGDGTQANPYQIENWNHLNNVRNHLSSHFVLNNDLTPETDGYATHVKDGATLANGGQGWAPIGKSGNPFTGVLDGANRSMSGLVIDRSTESQVGLFGATESGGRVVNLALLDVSVVGSFQTGALVGNARIGAGALSNLRVTGQVTSTFSRVGCLIGESYANVSEAHVDCAVVGTNQVGGLIGDNRSSVERSSSAGSVTGSASVGGLLGVSTDSVQKSFSGSQVSGSSAVGGLIGENNTAVANTYAIGNVTGTDGATTGGLIGINGRDDFSFPIPGGNVSNSYATGLVNGASADRAFIGTSVEDQFMSPIYSNNFFDADTSNQTAATASSATALTTLQMKTQTSFTNAGWDFTANTGVWAMEQGTYLSYPYLQGIGYDSPGTSPATQPIPGLVQPPGAPTGVSATATNAQATVSWTAPNDSGDSVITGYTVISAPGAQTCSTNGATTCTVTGLTNGTPYTFTVRATSSVGTGPASAPSTAITPATIPGAPTITSVTRGNQQVSIVFNAPNNGGSVITGYNATSNPGGLTGTCSASPCIVTGLTNGTAYTFTLTATNQAGTGPASVASASVTPATVPGAPANLGVIPRSGEVHITFVAGNNGGDAISNYEYSLDGGSTWTARVPATTTSPWIIEGLTNGTEYSVKIRAINSVGEGLASEAVVVCPSSKVFEDRFQSQGGGSPRCL